MPSSSSPDAPLVSRRALLLGVGGLVAGAALTRGPVASAATTAARAGASAAPTGVPAGPVDLKRFMSTDTFRQHGAEARALGLRETGSAGTEAYISTYAARLEAAGVQDVHLEPVPLTQWHSTGHGLTVAGRAVPWTFYAPYSGSTPTAGVTGELVFVEFNQVTSQSVEALELVYGSLAGKIVVFDLAAGSLPYAAFAGVSYPGALQVPTADAPRLSGNFSRPFLGIGAVITAIDLLGQAGAAAGVGIWTDLPKEWARQYVPYDGKLRGCPTLFVDSTQGPQLQALAKAGGTRATAVLTATVKEVTTNNLIGFIPGKTDELTVLHTHTDGTNELEENGTDGVLAAADYLVKHVESGGQLDRTIMVFLSTGHFAGGNGVRHWMAKEASGLVPKVSSILTIEHLGALEWLPDGTGAIRPTGNHEPGAFFGPDSLGLIAAATEGLKKMPLFGTVARPFLPAQHEPPGSTQQLMWPGEGTYFYTYGPALRDVNFITGPYALLAAGMDTTGMVDYELMRSQSVAATEIILRLAQTSQQAFDLPADGTLLLPAATPVGASSLVKP